MHDYYDYLDQHEGWVKVASQPWRWEAHYEDGQVLCQFNDNTGRFHRFAEIDQSRLVRFKMVSVHTKQEIVMDFKQGDKLTHKYVRGLVHIPANDQGDLYKHHYFFYVFGVNKQIVSLRKDGKLYLGDKTIQYATEQGKEIVDSGVLNG